MVIVPYVSGTITIVPYIHLESVIVYSIIACVIPCDCLSFT